MGEQDLGQGGQGLENQNMFSTGSEHGRMSWYLFGGER